MDDRLDSKKKVTVNSTCSGTGGGGRSSPLLLVGTVSESGKEPLLTNKPSTVTVEASIDLALVLSRQHENLPGLNHPHVVSKLMITRMSWPNVVKPDVREEMGYLTMGPGSTVHCCPLHKTTHPISLVPWSLDDTVCRYGGLNEMSSLASGI